MVAMAKTGKVWRCDPVKRKRGKKLNFFAR
jgi:hypothetical protein